MGRTKPQWDREKSIIRDATPEWAEWSLALALTGDVEAAIDLADKLNQGIEHAHKIANHPFNLWVWGRV